jgi:hypothetical protein
VRLQKAAGEQKRFDTEATISRFPILGGKVSHLPRDGRGAFFSRPSLSGPG